MAALKIPESIKHKDLPTQEFLEELNIPNTMVVSPSPLHGQGRKISLVELLNIFHIWKCQVSNKPGDTFTDTITTRY